MFILSRLVEEGSLYIFIYREKGASGKTQTTDVRKRKFWRAGVVRECR